MSLEERAKELRNKLFQIEREARRTRHGLTAILGKVQLDAVILEFSSTQKQQVLEWCETRIALLKALVDKLS